LQRLAEWAQLEQTTHWHTGLGWIMMEGYHYEEAVSHFKEALDQDSDAWVAKEGLARCLGEQGLYDEAIEWMENAIESLPSNMSWLAGYLCPRIAEWKRATGDHEGAFEAAERAYATESASALAQLRYLEALDASNFSDVIIQVIEELDGWETPGKDYSYLVRFFVHGYNAYDEIGKACRARGKPEFVLAAMDRAMTLIDLSDNESMKIWLPAQVAAFRYDYYDQVEEPMQLWETALKRIDAGDSAVQKSSAKTRKIYSNRLAQLYFDAAVASRNAGPDSAQYSTKLKGLSVVTETSVDDDDAFDFYGTGYASMLWGRWLRDYQDAEEGVWRKCFKARALEEMDMLDDNDPSNDTRGLHALSITLLQAGDRTNAGAILAVLFKPLEDLPTKQVVEDDDSDIPNGGNGEADEQDGGADDAKERYQDLPDPTTQSVADSGEPNALPSERTLKSEAAVLKAEDMSVVSPQTPQITKTRTVFGPENIDDATTQPLAAMTKQTTSQLKLELGDSWMYTCDGYFRDAQDAGEMYFCEICLDKNYCGDCLLEIKEASLWSRQCDPNHTHYRAWPIPSDARDMAVEWVEGEAALRIEWLEKLRKEWMA
jgi:tetratricopeptide (TPR) repeat protein